MPSIRIIRTTLKLKDCANDALRARHAEMTRDSLTFRFNESLSALEPPFPPVSHDAICTWLRECLPRYGMSSRHSYYCDNCSELKQQVDSARRAKQHLIDSGDAAMLDICAKEVLITSCEANLRQYRELAAKEQEEYKHRIARKAVFFPSNILACEANQISQGATSFCLEKETDADVVLVCDF